MDIIKRSEEMLSVSEAQLAILFENNPTGILIIDPDKRIIVDGNNAAWEMIGLNRNNVIGKLCHNFVCPAEINKCPICDLGQNIDRSERLLLRNDNSAMPILKTVVPLMLGDKKYLLESFIDITERKQAVDALQETNEFLKVLLNAIPVPVFFKDADGRYLGINRSFIDFYGLNQEALIGKSVFDIAPSDLAKLYHEKDAELFDQQGEQVYEAQLKDSRGNIHEVVFHKAAFTDAHGDLRGIIGVILDITERKKQEAIVRQTAEIQTVLREIVEAALLAKSLEELFAAVHNLVRRVLPAQNLYISLWDEVTGKIVRTYCVDELNFILPQRPFDSGFTEYVMRLGKAVHVTVQDVEDLRRSGEIKLFMPAGSEFIGAPLREPQGKIFGVISLYASGKDQLFQSRDKEILAIVAAQVSMAIERKRAEEELSRNLAHLNSAWNQTIRLLSDMAEVRDPYTAGHQKKVAKLATAIGKSIGCFSEEDLRGLGMAAILHDIGKINVPGEILSKPGKLSTAEFELIKTHSQSGYDLLRKAELPWNVAEIIYQHHERLNGSGYPRGLVDSEIIIEAKIIAVADVVEAMSSHRPYRAGLGIDAALNEVKMQAGILYDQEVVKHCLEIFREHAFSFEK